MFFRTLTLVWVSGSVDHLRHVARVMCLLAARQVLLLPRTQHPLKCNSCLNGSGLETCLREILSQSICMFMKCNAV